MTDTENQNELRDRSGDREYFVIVPRLIRLLCPSTYHVAVWETVKEIAGEKGWCMLDTRDLALLAGMSTGKFNQCRKDLVEWGLLNGERRQKHGGGFIWRLTVPDLWVFNTKVAKLLVSIKDRLEFRRRVIKSDSPLDALKWLVAGGMDRELATEIDESLPGDAFMDAWYEGVNGPTWPVLPDSPGEPTLSPHERALSPHEQARSPGEQARSPHETKKIQEEDPEVDPVKDNAANGAALSPDQVRDQLLRSVRRHYHEDVEYVPLDDNGDPEITATMLPLAAYIANHTQRNVSPNQRSKLDQGVIGLENYPSPEFLFERVPQFRSFVDEQIAWATGATGDGRKPMHSLVSAIRNYERPGNGWIDWNQRWRETNEQLEAQPGDTGSTGDAGRKETEGQGVPGEDGDREPKPVTEYDPLAHWRDLKRERAARSGIQA